jgi:N-methylhydantoinase A
VGPESAGSTPGPVCYGRGGKQPTVTDAAVVLGYIDPNFFLGGSMGLVADAARGAIADKVAGPLGVSIEEAALSILDLTTESMVNAIEDITVKQGIDPAHTVIIGGGGAAGINAVSIARRLRCGIVIFPGVGAVLSAAGAVLSEMSTEFSRTSFMTSSSFDCDKANAIVAELAVQCQTFFDKAGRAPAECRIDLSIEGRYPSQVWELEVPLRTGKFTGPADVGYLVADFHRRHTELFSFRDDGDEVEIMSWRAVARCPGPGGESITLVESEGIPAAPVMRSMFFRETGQVEAPTYHLESLPGSLVVTGPALVVSNFTTVVVNPGASAQRRPEGHLVVRCDT